VKCEEGEREREKEMIDGGGEGGKQMISQYAYQISTVYLSIHTYTGSSTSFDLAI